AVHADRRERYEEVRRAAARSLAGLASGELDPGDPRVQHTVGLQAARLRRLLAEHDDVPTPLGHGLRACAVLAERRGVAVDVASVGTLPPIPLPVRRGLTEAPLRVLSGSRTQARISIAAADGEVVVAVVGDIDNDLVDVESSADGHPPDVTVTNF